MSGTLPMTSNLLLQLDSEAGTCENHLSKENDFAECGELEKVKKLFSHIKPSLFTDKKEHFLSLQMELYEYERRHLLNGNGDNSKASISHIDD